MRSAIVASVGALIVLLIALGAGMSTHDTLEVAGIGAGTAVVGCIGGVFVLRLARRRSLATQIAATALVVLASVAVGAWVGAQAMFLSEHDLTTLAVILVAAGTVGVIAALVVGRRVGRASGALISVARQMGDGEVLADVPAGPVPDELARLYDELVVAAGKLTESRAREQALDQSRRELIAWVSHDLRTPLAAIRAVTEALEDGIVEDPDTVQRYHAILRMEADRLAGLVDDLFELSRTQAGVLQLEFARVSLGDLVSDALAGADAVAAAKGVRLEGRLDGPSPDVDASPPEVLRALRNVLENAIRFTPSDGTVVVAAGVTDRHCFIEVRDNGGGIAIEDLPRVFDVAFSGDAARTRDSGAGLGLAIARGLVEAHHGDISVRNENGGACFTLRLPLAATDDS
ncbi:MAG TPA: HAMP domain-containing sensor histidine kinase [Acidimicrobiia bacterium]|nr:HAMP domain-containing sensor histidine kinase [Acidimicrobiia bacterium]